MNFSKYIFDPTRRFAGLDLTGRFLRHARLSRHGSRIDLQSFGLGDSLAAFIRDGMVVDQKGLATAIHKAIAPLRVSSVNIVIPERHSFLVSFPMPATTSGDFSEAVRWEAAQRIPFDINELYLDWTNTDLSGSSLVTVLAAPRNVVDGFVQAVEQAGLTLLSIETTANAVYRLQTVSEFPLGTCMLLHLGETESFSLLLEQGLPVFSASVASTVDELETHLAKRFSLTQADAHNARLLLGYSDRRAAGLVRKVLLEQLDTLTSRTAAIVQYHAEHGQSTDPVGNVIVSGPGAETSGVSAALAERMHIPVSTYKLPDQIRLPKNDSSIAKDYQEYVVAMAAALKIEPHSV